MKLTIDYASHPAFAAISGGKGQHSIEAGQYFARMDDIWAELIAPESRVTAKEVGAVFDQRVASLLTDLKRALSQDHVPSDYLPFVFKALDDSCQAVRAEIVQVVAGRAYRGVRNARIETICAALRDKGAAAFRMERGTRMRIFESLKPFCAQVEAQRAGGSGARCFVAVPARGAHWDLLKDFVRKNHIEDAIGAFAGFPLELVGYALTLSHPGETWFKISYQDIGLPAPRTVQQHYDLDNLSAKSMLYLNDVGEENGPFSYIPDTKSFIASRSQTSYFKYLDYANNDYAIAKGAPETIYNRPLFVTPNLRPAFAALPVELQGTACPGDDVLDGTPLSQALLKGERPLTSEDGDLMLFAGGETLHRGGVVSAGERYALQMMYKSPPSIAEKLVSLPRQLGSRAKQIVFGT
jgi:hypothetical protein